MNSWILTIEEDPDTKDLVLPFTDEILKAVGWKLGDTLEWIDLKNGTWQLKKIDKTAKESV